MYKYKIRILVCFYLLLTMSNVSNALGVGEINGYGKYNGLPGPGNRVGNGDGDGDGDGDIAIALTNDVAVLISGLKNSQSHYSLFVPAGITNASISISGGTGDADLYVRKDSLAAVNKYNCRPYLNTNFENCSGLDSGTYYIMVYGYRSYNNVNLPYSCIRNA